MAANYYSRERNNNPSDIGLSFVGGNFRIHNVGITTDVPITSIRGLDGQLYTGEASAKMQLEHILLNALDSIKDGANKHTVVGLNVYNCKSIPQDYISFPSKLHEIEASIIEANKDFITVNAVTKTKKGKQTAYVINDADDWFKESGLHPSYLDADIVFNDGKIIISIATLLDPLEKNLGTVFPAVGRTLGIYTSAMNQFGCPDTSIISTTQHDGGGGDFHYSVLTGCGVGCVEGSRCEITHANGRLYTGGNASKNEKIGGTGPGAKSAEKTKLIVVKELGDKSQVIVNFIYKHINPTRRSIMITCDMVVFIFCIMLNLECIYTGPYDNVGYATVHFRPGSMLDKTRTDAFSTLRKIYEENESILRNMKDLYNHPDTTVMLGGQAKTFNKLFYGAIVKDITLLQYGLQLEIVLRQTNNDTRVAKLQEFRETLDLNHADDIIGFATDYFNRVFVAYQVIASNYRNAGANDTTNKTYIKNINEDVKRITNQYTIIPPITRRGGNLQMKLSGYYTIDKSNLVSAMKPGFRSFGLYYSPTRPLHSYASHDLSRSGGGRRRSQRGGAINGAQFSQFQEDDFDAVGKLTPDPIPFVLDRRYNYSYEHNRTDDDNVFYDDDLRGNVDLNQIVIVPMFKIKCNEFMQRTYPNNAAYHSFKDDVIHTLWTLLMYQYMRIGGTGSNKMEQDLYELYREYIDHESSIMEISRSQQPSHGQSYAAAAAPVSYASIFHVEPQTDVSFTNRVEDMTPIHLNVEPITYDLAKHMNRATASAAASVVEPVGAASAASAANSSISFNIRTFRNRLGIHQGGKKRRTKRAKRTKHKTKKNRR